MREEGKEEEENGITGEKAAEGDGRRREDRGARTSLIVGGGPWCDGMMRRDGEAAARIRTAEL